MGCEEVPHQQRGVGTFWINESSWRNRTTPAPGMTHAIDFVILHQCLPLVGISRDRIGIASWYLSSLNCIRGGIDRVVLQAIISLVVHCNKLLDHLVAVDWSDGEISGALKHDDG